MKILLTILAALSLGSLAAAEGSLKTHKVVIQFTSEGDKQAEALLNNIENLFAAFGDKVEVAVIAHGPGISLLQSANAANAGRIEKLSDRRTAFIACENTMKRKQLTKADLFRFVETVDSGVAEVVRRQGEGWAYIKGGY